MDNKELKELRLSLGLTQSKMAEKLGIKRGQVAKLEAGACKVRGAVELLALKLANGGNE